MGFKCGLVGLPNAGKSTIFNALTNLGVEATAYPFCTIDPHFGIVPLEDERLNLVHRIAGSAKKTPTVLEFVDIAGLIKGASHGEGLGNQFLSHISRVDAIVHVVRCFDDANVAHPSQTMDPVRDAQDVTLELILKDMELIDRRVQKIKTAAKTGDPLMKKNLESLEPLAQAVQNEQELRLVDLNPLQSSLVREMNCLTAKPVIFIANVDELQLQGSPMTRALESHAVSVRAPCIPFCGKVQAEIAELAQEEQIEFLNAMGLEETALQKIVRTGYEVLRLITFFTANANEAHAWTVPKGSDAVHAAGLVHTDFQEKFIKAEVIKTAELKMHGSMKTLHDLGLIAVHGRDYVVEDGDLLLFKIRG
ncbi:redox-regulated ATPase YchF [bacterium]|nr:redox-regulated ATPase YchF [bacterium]